MLITLFLWVYISAVAYSNGLMVQGILAKLFQIQSADNELSIVETAWLGMAWLICLCGYTYWFSPVGWGVHLVALILPICWYLSNRKNQTFMLPWSCVPTDHTNERNGPIADAKVVGGDTQPRSKSNKLVKIFNLDLNCFGFAIRNKFPFKTPWLEGIALLALAVILTRTTLDPRIKDTGGYHAQMIRWIEEYPVVQGLANLNYRLGFNNSWFLANALFSFSWFKVSFHVLNGWAMLSLGIQALVFAQTQWRFFYGAMFALFLYYFHWQLSSPSPDLPAHLLVALSFGLWLRMAPKPISLAHGAFIVLSITAFTIKTSTAPLLLLTVWLGLDFLGQKQWSVLLKMIGLGLFFLIYWLVSNVILTGYVLYPLTNNTLDFFDFDWEVPRRIIVEGINNLTENTRPPEAQHLPFPLWLPHWIARIDWAERVIYAIVIAKSMACVLSATRWKNLNLEEKLTIKTLVVAWVGIVFWLSVAPILRFGIGFVAVPLVMPVYFFKNPNLPEGLKPLGGLRLNFIFCSYVFFYIFLMALLYSSLKRQNPTIVFPREYPKATTRSYENKGMRIFVAANDTTTYRGIRGYWGDCYHHALPCTPYETQNFEPRGQYLQNGFRAVEK